jgi:hypothetical protein
MNSLTLNAEREPVECRSRTRGEFANSYPRDAAFEQLLRWQLRMHRCKPPRRRVGLGSVSGEAQQPRTSSFAPTTSILVEAQPMAMTLTIGYRQSAKCSKSLSQSQLALALAFGLLKDSVER